MDAVSDGMEVFIGGIQEHIEEAGVHSGDAACVLPAQTLPPKVLESIRRITRRICRALGVVGLVNLQLAVKDGAVYVLEANPRASRTVPYVSKAIGVPLAKIATKVMLGKTLKQLGLHGEAAIGHVAVKAPVFPFQKLPGVDAILGPEMKSTGEVMGIDSTLGRAYYKAMLAAGSPLPAEGAVYITVRDEDKDDIVPVAAKLVELGLRVYATKGTAGFLRDRGVDAATVYRISEHQSPDALGLMRRGGVRLVVKTPPATSGGGAQERPSRPPLVNPGMNRTRNSWPSPVARLQAMRATPRTRSARPTHVRVRIGIPWPRGRLNPFPHGTPGGTSRRGPPAAPPRSRARPRARPGSS